MQLQMGFNLTELAINLTELAINLTELAIIGIGGKCGKSICNFLGT